MHCIALGRVLQDKAFAAAMILGMFGTYVGTPHGLLDGVVMVRFSADACSFNVNIRPMLIVCLLLSFAAFQRYDGIRFDKVKNDPVRSLPRGPLHARRALHRNRTGAAQQAVLHAGRSTWGSQTLFIS